MDKMSEYFREKGSWYADWIMRKEGEEGRYSLTVAALCLALVENHAVSVQDSFELLKLNVQRALWPLNPAI